MDERSPFKPEDRFPCVKSLAESLGAWLDGSQKRAQALTLVRTARQINEEIESLQLQSHQAKEEIQALAQREGSLDLNGLKEHLWILEDKRDGLNTEITLLKAKQTQIYRSALTHKSDLFEAHAGLALSYQSQHQELEYRGEHHQAKLIELSLKEHLEALPQESRAYQELSRYLSGTARCHLNCNVEGAKVSLAPFHLKQRRLVLGPREYLGSMPLHDYPLEIGSYLLTLEHPGYHKLIYPLYNQRNDHIDGLNPEGNSHPIQLLPLGALEADDRYVPAGWCTLGGDPHTPNSLPKQRVWIEGFVIKAIPVTNGEYVVFLNDLIDQGRHDEALRHVPREQSSSDGERGSMVYTLQERFALHTEDRFERHPVTRIEWYSARAYASWLALKTDKPWRLPMEFEWEKAARGVDGRSYPWGEYHDPRWSCMKDSHSGEVKMYDVDQFPLDVSLYGVRGTAGNTRDWCLDTFRDDGPPLQAGRLLMPTEEDLADSGFKSTRGGSYGNSESRSRSADRDWWFPHRSYIGRDFRLLWSLQDLPSLSEREGSSKEKITKLPQH